MQVIGEKINGTRKRVAQAIRERDAPFILDLAGKQAEAGATWLDVNAGTHPSSEPGDLIWLIQTIQPVVDVPLCLDSANSQALVAAMLSMWLHMTNASSASFPRFHPWMAPGRPFGPIAMPISGPYSEPVEKSTRCPRASIK